MSLTPFRYRVPARPLLPEVQGEEPDWHPPVLGHQPLQGAMDVPQGRARDRGVDAVSESTVSILSGIRDLLTNR